MNVYIVKDLESFGEGATEETLAEYETFARNWLDANGYQNANIEMVDGFPPQYEEQEERDIAEAIWQAFINQ